MIWSPLKTSDNFGNLVSYHSRSIIDLFRLSFPQSSEKATTLLAFVPNPSDDSSLPRHFSLYKIIGQKSGLHQNSIPVDVPFVDTHPLTVEVNCVGPQGFNSRRNSQSEGQFSVVLPTETVPALHRYTGPKISRVPIVAKGGRFTFRLLWSSFSTLTVYQSEISFQFLKKHEILRNFDPP